MTCEPTETLGAAPEKVATAVELTEVTRVVVAVVAWTWPSVASETGGPLLVGEAVAWTWPSLICETGALLLVREAEAWICPSLI